MNYINYGKFVKINKEIPHSFSKVEDEVELTIDSVISNNPFINHFGWDGAIRDSKTKEVEIKTKDFPDKVYLLTQDGFFGFVSLLPRDRPNSNNILLGNFES